LTINIYHPAKAFIYEVFVFKEEPCVKPAGGAEGSFLLSFCAFGRIKEAIKAEASTPAYLLEKRQREGKLFASFFS
jgi:hypothetical protein